MRNTAVALSHFFVFLAFFFACFFLLLPQRWRLLRPRVSLDRRLLRPRVALDRRPLRPRVALDWRELVAVDWRQLVGTVRTVFGSTAALRRGWGNGKTR